MSDEPKKKQHKDSGRAKFASAAVKRELDRVAQQAAPAGGGMEGANALASPLTPENVVKAVLGGPQRQKEGPSSKDKLHRSISDWPIISRGG
jgi:hypothetical protein